MTKPLAILFYERLLPGSQLANRLKDVGYRVEVVQDLGALTAAALRHKPLVIVADLVSQSGSVVQVIGDLRRTADTSHIPVLSYATRKDEKLRTEAVTAGAALVASDEAIVQQLPQLLEQVLSLD